MQFQSHEGSSSFQTSSVKSTLDLPEKYEKTCSLQHASTFCSIKGVCTWLLQEQFSLHASCLTQKQSPFVCEHSFPFVCPAQLRPLLYQNCICRCRWGLPMLWSKRLERNNYMHSLGSGTLMRWAIPARLTFAVNEMSSGSSGILSILSFTL